MVEKYVSTFQGTERRLNLTFNDKGYSLFKIYKIVLTEIPINAKISENESLHPLIHYISRIFSKTKLTLLLKLGKFIIY